MLQVEGKAVGFMSVCSSVNLPLLHECFDLGPFHGFCVPHPDDLLEPSRESSIKESQGTVAVPGHTRKVSTRLTHSCAIHRKGILRTFQVPFMEYIHMVIGIFVKSVGPGPNLHSHN